MRKVVYYFTMSLDGYIADSKGSTSWMHGVPNEDYGFREFIDTVDTVVLGRSTYEQMLDMGDFFPYADKQVLVATSNLQLKRAADCVELIPGDEIEKAVARLVLSEEQSGNIWIGGGARLGSSLFAAGLVDEVVIHIQPTVLGSGLRWIEGEGIRRHGLELRECKQMPGGLVKLRYRTVKSWRSDV
jgi:dihydrofolate reductase